MDRKTKTETQLKCTNYLKTVFGYEHEINRLEWYKHLQPPKGPMKYILRINDYLFSVTHYYEGNIVIHFRGSEFMEVK